MSMQFIPAGGGAPSGAAGGDLGGTYPNPTVSKVDTLASVLAAGNDANALGITNLGSLGFTNSAAVTATLAALGIKGIIDIQQIVKTDKFISGATAWTDVTGLTGLSITTLAAADKVIVRAVLQACADNGNEVSFLRLVRDAGTVLSQGDAASARTRAHAEATNVGAFRVPPIVMEFIDTPGSIGTFTYKVQFFVSGALDATKLVINASSSDADAAYEGRFVSTLTAELFHAY